MNESQMTLGTDYTPDVNPVGWLVSEKLNGCRAYWDGSQFWTRGGNVIAAPDWFIDGLPAVHLDGEYGRAGDALRKPALPSSLVTGRPVANLWHSMPRQLAGHGSGAWR